MDLWEITSIKREMSEITNMSIFRVATAAKELGNLIKKTNTHTSKKYFYNGILQF